MFPIIEYDSELFNCEGKFDVLKQIKFFDRKQDNQ